MIVIVKLQSVNCSLPRINLFTDTASRSMQLLRKNKVQLSRSRLFPIRINQVVKALEVITTSSVFENDVEETAMKLDAKETDMQLGHFPHELSERNEL